MSFCPRPPEDAAAAVENPVACQRVGGEAAEIIGDDAAPRRIVSGVVVDEDADDGDVTTPAVPFESVSIMSGVRISMALASS